MAVVLVWLGLIGLLILLLYTIKTSPDSEQPVDKEPSSMWARFLMLFVVIWYVVMEIKFLPYDTVDVWYLQSIEFNIPSILEFLHPLYVPFMYAIHVALKGLKCYHRFIYVLEGLNIFIDGLALLVLYRLGERLAGSWSSLLATTLWSLMILVREAAIRPVPYAWAGFILMLAWYITLTKKLNSRTIFLSGLLLGITAGLHLSASVLVIAFVIYYSTSMQEKHELKRGVVNFTFGFFLTFISSYLLLYLKEAGNPYVKPFHVRINMQTIARWQQVPHSSVFDASIPHLFSVFYHRTVWFLVLSFVYISLIWVFNKKDRSRFNILRAFLLNLLILGFFFLFFNVYNGFIFAVFILLAPLGAVALHAVPVSKKIRFLYGILALAFLVRYMPGQLIEGLGKENSFFQEIKMLNSRLDSKGVLVIPGRVIIGEWYFAKFSQIEVLNTLDRNHKDIPLRHLKTVPLSKLVPVIRKYLSKGIPVIYTEGFTGNISGFDKPGQESRKQVFRNICGFTAKLRKQCVKPTTAVIKKAFLLQKAMVGPLGDNYFRVLLP